MLVLVNTKLFIDLYFWNYTVTSCYKMCNFIMKLSFQLKADIEELNVLLSQAKRKRVMDLISIEIRKLESELIKIKESQQPALTKPTASTSSDNKRYQIKLNGYGNYHYLFSFIN